MSNSGAVERSNFGTELINTSTVSGNASIPLNRETVLGYWESTSEAEERIGIPWLSEIPVIKYLFSTTVTTKERSCFFLTVTAQLPDTAAPGKVKEE
jgi:type II secretory pathway component GspD/PulD (secretin)